MKTTQRKDIKGDSIVSLPSIYRGVEFRSRMEARWAAYFDLLQILWIYEPDGIRLPSGNYCPDFQIKPLEYSSWFYAEVKPTGEAADFIEPKLIELAEACGGLVYCLIGNPQERRQHRDYEASFNRQLYRTESRCNVPSEIRRGEGAFSWLAFVYKQWGCLDYCGEYDDDDQTLDLLNRMRFENGVCSEDFRRLAIKR